MFRGFAKFLSSSKIGVKPPFSVFESDKEAGDTYVGTKNEDCSLYIKIFAGCITLGSYKKTYRKSPIQVLKQQPRM